MEESFLSKSVDVDGIGGKWRTIVLDSLSVGGMVLPGGGGFACSLLAERVFAFIVHQ